MNLPSIYTAISPSVVAIAVKSPAAERLQGVPQIIGTGFVVADGLVATNDHVIREVGRLLTPDGADDDDWPIIALVFFEIPGKGMAQLEMSVLGAFTINKFEVPGTYFGPAQPDIGFLHVNMRGLPCLAVSEALDAVVPGSRIATAGFPMGTACLAAPGYIHQLTPTLQEGIVSAVLPFPCSHPHALMLNMMSQGGASGSPIFLQHEPVVVGILYAGLEETYVATVQNCDIPYKVPTNFTYCVPGHLLHKAIGIVKSKVEFELPADAPHISEAIERAMGASMPSSTTPTPRISELR
jgi:hypothetical protein